MHPQLNTFYKGQASMRTNYTKLKSKPNTYFYKRMRYSKTTAGDIVFGSPELGGFGFMNLYMEQGLLNLQLLMKAHI